MPLRQGGLLSLTAAVARAWEDLEKGNAAFERAREKHIDSDGAVGLFLLTQAVQNRNKALNDYKVELRKLTNSLCGGALPPLTPMAKPRQVSSGADLVRRAPESGQAERSLKRSTQSQKDENVKGL